jgi:hypothetical protein
MILKIVWPFFSEKMFCSCFCDLILIVASEYTISTMDYGFENLVDI